MKFTAHEKQLLLPIICQCLENRPDKRPSSVMLVQELRHIESTLPRGSPIAAPIEWPRQQLSAKEEECRQTDLALMLKNEALKENEEAVREKSATIRGQQAKIQWLRDQLTVPQQVS